MSHEDNVIGAGETPEDDPKPDKPLSADYWMGAYDAVMSLARQALHEWGRSHGGHSRDLGRIDKAVRPSGSVDGGASDDPDS